ncbi:MAG TPA: bacteriochlorophyll 4-vinyl reductase [Pseudogracilibacillus sp.]|nr:bacteriochlorophyll 4-vinyl reductase [Pseudogracilibacillus sp.]
MKKNKINIDMDTALEKVLKIPGVKIGRESFLTNTFSELVTPTILEEILKEGPYIAGVKKEVLDNIAKSRIKKNTLSSTSASFVAGLPGGIAMTATIPADIMQFLGVSLRLAQELAYLYGHKDLWLEEHIDTEDARNKLLLFLGVMFGVGGTTSAVKFLSSGFSKAILKKLPQQALTKTLYYPIIKKVAGYVGVKLTKDSFAKGVSKIVPVLGGVVSGSITYVTMGPMGKKLADALSDSLTLNKEDIMDEYKVMKDNFPDIIDVDFEEIILEED